MLKRVCLAAVCVAILGGAAVWAWPSEAQCAYCPKIKCLDAVTCGGECVCLKPAGSRFGQCVSFD